MVASRGAHPLLQYRVLQTLRRRGTVGTLAIERAGEKVEIDIESVPLKPDDFPPAVQEVPERVGEQTQVHDPTLFYFAQEPVVANCDGFVRRKGLSFADRR